jgi:hypothetical protein
MNFPDRGAGAVRPDLLHERLTSARAHAMSPADVTRWAGWLRPARWRNRANALKSDTFRPDLPRIFT